MIALEAEHGDHERGRNEHAQALRDPEQHGIVTDEEPLHQHALASLQLVARREVFIDVEVQVHEREGQQE